MNKSDLVIKKQATYEDLLAVPAPLVAEILNGELVTHPRPAPRHSLAGSALGMLLGSAYQMGVGGPGDWWILDEPELHLGKHVIVPDLAGWRKERMPSPPHDQAWIDIAPDWICEVLSPSTAQYDMTIKRDIYAEFGVKYHWFVDPMNKTLEAFVLQEDKSWKLLGSFGENDTVSVKPFDAISLDLEHLWLPKQQ